MLIKEKIDKYSVDNISKNLNIPKATLYRWINEEKIDNQIKFIKLLKYLEITIDEFLKEK